MSNFSCYRKVPVFLAGIYCFAAAYLFGAESFVKREYPIKMTTSIVVPCVQQHFQHIFGLLFHYQNQTCPPDQVVISLSQAERVPDEEILQVEDYPWSFEVKVIKNRGMRSAGENRTIGSENSSGDLILFQDADDVPHPQRVEIVKFIFENYYVDHLMHSFFIESTDILELDFRYLDHLKRAHFPGSRDFPLYKSEWLQLERYEAYEAAIYVAKITLTNGNPCVTREVMKQIKWDSYFELGEDGRFNRKVYRQFKNNGIVRAYLYKYRKDFSSFRKENAIP